MSEAFSNRIRETVAWELGRRGNVPFFSKQHIWNRARTRMLCGVAPGWKIGNFGQSHSGKCARCFAIAEADRLVIETRA